MLVDTINKIKNVQVGYIGSDGLFDSATVNAYTASLRGLSATQAEVALSSAGLDKAQQKQILNNLNATKSTISLTSAEATEALTKKIGSQEEANKLLIKAKLITAEEIEKGVTIELTSELIKEKVALGLITQEEGEQILTTFGLTNANIGLGKSFALLGKTIWSTLKPLLTNPFTWAIVGGLALAGVIDYLTISYDEANEALDEANEKYKETESNISSLNNELTTNKEKIEELRKLESDGTITDSQKEELENLENKNKQLETQIVLQKELLELQNRDKAEAAKDVANAESHSVAQSVEMGDETGKSTYKGTVGTVTDTEAIKEDLALIDEYELKVSNLETELIEAKQAVSNAESPFAKWTAELKVSNIEKEIQKYKDSLTTLYEDLQTRSTNAQETLEALKLDPETNADEIKIYEIALASMQEQLVEVKEAIENTKEEVKSFEDALSGIQSLSTGLDQLDKIYADVKDGETFDFSSILNNNSFKEAFGGLGESYENFIQTITNSPSDIKACQSAFDNLATAYINNSGALNNLTEETKNSTIEMLKQMGVANAEEIVINQLKARTLAQSDVFKNLTSATLENTDELYNNVQQLIAEADASGITISAMADLVAQQQIFNNQNLDVNSKIQSLAKLASAFGAVADAANISAHQQYMATEISMAYRDGASASDIEAIKNGYLKSASNTFQNAINAKFGSLSSKVNYTGGSKTNSGSSKSQSEKEFNWIETLLSRIQNKISDLGKTVSATWKSWTDRNSALKSQISAVSQEISLQQQAISKYESIAGSLGLSSHYQNLVRNGALDISTITDENLAEKISKYQEYWEKIVSAEDAIQDLEDELHNLARTQFDNIAKQFDSEISLVEANISTLEAYIDQTEMKGNLVSKNYYSAMYEQEEKNLSYLQQKYDQLSNKLSDGSIAQGTEEFNSMATDVKEVSKAIIESNTALEEYQKTMRELDWEVFDLIEEKIGNVTEESEFLIDLLSNSKLFNDDGSITSQGQATLGLHVANMRIYESQVKDYADEIAKLDKEFANDSLDQNYLERRQELLELQRESILNCESEKSAIKDLYSDGMDNLLSYMDELISKRKELLNSQKD